MFREKALSMIVAAGIMLQLPLKTLAGDDWIQYVDESAQRIVADPAVGIADTFEKDLAIGDLDNDGDTDLVIARKVRFSSPGGLPNVLFMNENGLMVDRTATLAPQFADLTDDRDIAVVDVDGDGWLDVVTVTTFAHQPRVYMNLGNGPLGWRGLEYSEADNRIPPFNPPPQFCAVGVGDVTGNDRPDLFFVDYSNNLEDRLLINDGNGFFTDETALRMTAAMSQSAFGTAGEIFDINGDGALDIIKCNTLGGSPNSIRVIYNDGTGFFDFMDHVYTGAPYMMATGDLNNDGRLDIYVVDDNQDHYLLNLGNDASGHAIFQNKTVSNSPATGGFGGNIRFADLDDDGYLDVLVSDVDTDIPGCNRRLTALENQGNTPSVTLWDPFGGANRPWLTNGAFDTVVLDIDGDGTLDIWAGICDGNRVFMGVSTTVAGDFDDDGDVDLFDVERFFFCYSGPGNPHGFGCGPGDLDNDGDVDFSDFAGVQQAYTGP